MRIARTVALCCLIASFQPLARAQESGKSSALQDDLKILREENQQILSSLNDIKQLLVASVARPAPQPPTPPSELSAREHDFRGSSNAPVAIIEYADFECPYCGHYVWFE